MDIERGNKVQYIGHVSTKYIKTDKSIRPEGKKGVVISDPYQLSAVPHTLFVDVEWFFETPKDEGLKVRPVNKGHVVNVANLKVID